jgi:hypothetical protein
MSLAITGTAPQSVYGAATAPQRNPAMREAMRDLTQSLKASDLAGARQAYAAILKNAPEGAQFPRGSEFAKIGRALVEGDISAAQSAFRSMVQGRFDGRPVPPLPQSPQSASATSAGLDLVA